MIRYVGPMREKVPAIRMVNEAQLSALATETTTGVLVDRGEAGFSVTPIFYGCPVASGVRAEACGGGDITKFLDYMLLSRTNEQFNQMVRLAVVITVVHFWMIFGVPIRSACGRDGISRSAWSRCCSAAPTSSFTRW